MPRAKKYIFTLNNYTPEHIANLKKLYDNSLQYLKYGYEIAPTTGTPHLQGYLICKKEETMKALRSVVGPALSLRTQRGTDLDNEIYVTKSDHYEEFGTLQVIVPNIELVVSLLLPEFEKIRIFTTTPTTKDMRDFFVRTRKSLLNLVREECPVQYIRHKKGISDYIDDFIDSLEIFYSEREYHLQ